MGSWGSRNPGGRNSQCKDPEAGTRPLVHGWRETSEAGPSGKTGSQRAGAGSGRASQASGRTVAFGLR